VVRISDPAQGSPNRASYGDCGSVREGANHGMAPGGEGPKILHPARPHRVHQALGNAKRRHTACTVICVLEGDFTAIDTSADRRSAPVVVHEREHVGQILIRVEESGDLVAIPDDPLHQADILRVLVDEIIDPILATRASHRRELRVGGEDQIPRRPSHLAPAARLIRPGHQLRFKLTAEPGQVRSWVAQRALVLDLNHPVAVPPASRVVARKGQGPVEAGIATTIRSSTKNLQLRTKASQGEALAQTLEPIRPDAGKVVLHRVIMTGRRTSSPESPALLTLESARRCSLHLHAGWMEELADRVLRALRVAAQPMDDDQLCQYLKVRPRQTINRVCHKLADRGLIRRVDGPSGKIVNVAREQRRLDASAEDAPAGVEVRADVRLDHGSARELPPGSSHEQRAAEREMLDLLSQELGLELSVARLALPSGARMEIDGADPDRTVLVEAWAHQGEPKAAQKHKVLADALKLVYAADLFQERPHLILLMSDQAAARPFTAGRSWAADALRHCRIEVRVVTLQSDTRERILAAQERQRR
jgi:hypothetical protein